MGNDSSAANTASRPQAVAQETRSIDRSGSGVGSRRITEIEGIRGLLSLIVVGGHLFVTNGWHPENQPLFWYAGCMDVFFCISGFLITRILLGNQDRPDFHRAAFLKNYFIRRILRIWPMYYLGMLFAYLVYRVSGGMTAHGEFHPWHPAWYEVLIPFFYLQNVELYFGHPLFNYLFIFVHSWSVAVEEQFYLVWPFVVLFLLRRAGPALRLAAGGGAILLAMVLRVKLLHLSTVTLWLLATRLDGFVLGALLAYVERAVAAGQAAPALSRMFRWLWLWPCIELLPYLSQGYFGIDWHLPRSLDKTLFDPFFNFALLGFSLIGYCVFFGSSVHGKSPVVRLLNLRPLAHLGAISYSTYLLHVPIVFALLPLLRNAYDLSTWASFAIGYALTLGLAHFTYTFVEAQAMRLKKRFGYAAEPRSGT